MLGGGLAVVAVIAIAAYLAGAFNSDDNSHTPSTIGRDGIRRALPSLAGDAGDSPTSSRRAGSRLSGAPMMAALHNYWADIERHEFAAAYGYYAPGATNLTEAEFTSSLERSGVKTVKFDGTVTASTKSLDLLDRSFATVAVTSLVTDDDEHGCRQWSGSYTMFLEESGLWHIQHAALDPRPC